MAEDAPDGDGLSALAGTELSAIEIPVSTDPRGVTARGAGSAGCDIGILLPYFLARAASTSAFSLDTGPYFIILARAACFAVVNFDSNALQT